MTKLHIHHTSPHPMRRSYRHIKSSGHALIATLLCVHAVNAKDLDSQDILGLSEAAPVNGETVVSVHVENDQPLAAFDIPIRYGQPADPITLLRVDFGNRVDDWDFLHAEIDNQNKTVILGMIAMVGGLDQNSDLAESTANNTEVARLVFQIGAGHKAAYSIFITEDPHHDLTFLYYAYKSSGADVKQFKPNFEVDNTASKLSVVPSEFSLSHNFPNPFNASTRFTLSMPVAGNYDIRIFNVTGQQVKVLQGHSEAGTHTFEWDGKSDQGQPVASGVYFYRAKVGQEQETRMMMLLK